MVAPLNLSFGDSTMKAYYHDVLSRLERNDRTLTSLHIDDFHYPMVDLEGDDNLDAETLVRLFSQACRSPYIRSLELRFVEFDHGDSISSAFQALLLDPHKQWDSVSVTACSGMTSNDYCAIASALDRCQTLYWHQNQTSANALGTLGISLASTTSLHALHLTRGDLCGDHARALLDGLGTNTHLIRLVMNFCRFDSDGVEALAEVLRQNSYLQELDLGACHLQDSQIERVVLALQGHPTLQSLVFTLNGCHIQGAQAIGQLLQDPFSRLETLNLSHQNTKSSSQGSVSDFVEPIAKALLTNTSLKRLRLSRNRLTCLDVTGLISSLTINQTLQVLDLNSNQLGDAGAMMIAATLSKLQGLRELYLVKNDIRLSETCITLWTSLQTSNPILHVLEYGPCQYQEQIRYELALNAAGRCLLIHDRVPLGLWPHVLERVLEKPYSPYLHHSKHSFRWDCLYHLLQGPALLSRR